MINLSIKELNELIYSLGITATNGKLCDKELNNTLLDKLYSELNRKISEEAIDEEIEQTVNVRVHFVDNDEADEDAYTDYRSTLEQDEQRYEDKKDRLNGNGVSQKILDFVEEHGAVSYGAINQLYRKFTGGSNSLSHIIKALMIPYKNRPTRRYIKQIARGTYVVDIATPQNWVVK